MESAATGRPWQVWELLDHAEHSMRGAVAECVEGVAKSVHTVVVGQPLNTVALRAKVARENGEGAARPRGLLGLNRAWEAFNRPPEDATPPQSCGSDAAGGAAGAGQARRPALGESSGDFGAAGGVSGGGVSCGGVSGGGVSGEVAPPGVEIDNEVEDAIQARAPAAPWPPSPLPKTPPKPAPRTAFAADCHPRGGCNQAVSERFAGCRLSGGRRRVAGRCDSAQNGCERDAQPRGARGRARGRLSGSAGGVAPGPRGRGGRSLGAHSPPRRPACSRRFVIRIPR